jgi:hypothetical protein
MSDTEAFAGRAGQLLGAARACGADGEALAEAATRVFARINERSAGDLDEMARATELFTINVRVGRVDVDHGAIACRAARTAFARFERQLTGPRE